MRRVGADAAAESLPARIEFSRSGIDVGTGPGSRGFSCSRKGLVPVLKHLLLEIVSLLVISTWNRHSFIEVLNLRLRL